MRPGLLSLLIILCALLLTNAPAIAGGRIDLPNGYIDYQSGYFDSGKLDGDISGVTIHDNRKIVAEASRLVIKTRPMADSLGMVVERLEIDDLLIMDDSTAVSLGSFYLDGMVVEGVRPSLAALQQLDTDRVQLLETGAINLKEMDLLDTDSGIRMYLRSARMTSLPITYTDPLLLDEHRFDLALEGGSIIPDPEYSSNSELLDLLAMLGLERIDFAMESRAQSLFENGGERLRQTSVLGLELAGLAGLDIELDMSVLGSTLKMLEAMQASGQLQESDDRMMETLGPVLLSGIMLNQVRLMLDDQGLLGLSLDNLAVAAGQTRQQFVSSMMALVSLQLGLYAPASQALITPPVQRFLEQGGQLTISLRPAEPVALMALAGFAAVPDTMLSVLGLQIDHQP